MKFSAVIFVSVLCASATLGDDRTEIVRNLNILQSWIDHVPSDVYENVVATEGQLYSFFFAGFEGLVKRIDFVRHIYRKDDACTHELNTLKHYKERVQRTFEEIKGNYTQGLSDFRDEYMAVIVRLTKAKKAIEAEDCAGGVCADLLDRSFYLLVDDGTDLFNVLRFKAVVADTIARMSAAFSAANAQTDEYIRALMEKCH